MELLSAMGPGQILLADRACDSDTLRESLAARCAGGVLSGTFRVIKLGSPFGVLD